MAANQSQRPKFYEEQYLGAEDLTAAVEYSRIQQARHALGAHTWGIAIGLQLKETPQPGGAVSLHLLPGYAWDGYGRPIVVLSPYKIPEETFSAIKFDPTIDTDGKGRLIPVWLRYDESAMQNPRFGFEVCEAADQRSRIQETFRIEIGELGMTDRYSGVTVATKSLTDAKTALRAFDATAPLVYDEAIPQQSFPEPQDSARWLIPIGYVRWLPLLNEAGRFVARDDSVRLASSPDPLKDSDKIRAFRRYIGVVAETIEAADGTIRLRDRAKDPKLSKFSAPLTVTDPEEPPDNELVWVEGHLRVEGHVKLHTDGSLFAPGSAQNLRIVAGHVNNSGGVVAGDRFTASRSAAGAYSVLFADPFPSPNPPVVVASPVNADKSDTLLTLRNLTGKGFDIVSTDVIPGGTGENNPQNTEFTFIAMGLR